MGVLGAGRRNLEGQDGARLAPRGAKTRQVGPIGAKMGPSWGQAGPSGVQDDPKRAPREAKLSSREPSWSIWGQVGATWRAKMEPSWRQERPRRAKLGQVGAKMGPSWGQVGPSWVQNDPKRAPREAKLSFRGPSWSMWGQVEGEGGDLLESSVFPRENLYFGESGGSFWRLLGQFWPTWVQKCAKMI